MTMFGNAIGLSPGNLGMKLFKPSAAAPALWWDPLNEGLPVVGAYRAIATVGSPWLLAPANYAESLQNWANPGTYTLTEIGGGSVNWAANVGWSGFTALNRCLDTNIVPTLDQTWTVLIEYSNSIHPARVMFGLYDNIGHNGSLLVWDRGADASSGYGVFGLAMNPPVIANAGNYGFAGRQPYRNAIPEAVLIPIGVGTTDLSIYIGARNLNGGLSVPWTNGIVAALVVYSGTLSGAQVATVDAAMGQL